MITSTRGYTLLEMIVSVGIFSMVMLVVTGAYLTLISLDREARATNQLSASLSFAIESMTRNIRTGISYACNGSTASPNCPSGSSRFVFTDAENQRITYFLMSDDTIGQCIGTPCTEAAATPLTDPRIVIEDLRFYVQGVGNSDGAQPHVTFTVRGTMETDVGESATFVIQNGATQRLLEI